MKNKFMNSVDIKGYVFNHKLEKRVSGPQSKNPGTNYIRGSINIATDVDAMNVVPVNYTYVPEFTKAGAANDMYTTLAQVIDANNTYELNGQSAMKVRISGNIESNDFITRDGEMASPKRIRGGFIHPENGDIANVGCASFKADMLIENYSEFESGDGDMIGRLRGYVFSFKNDFIPVDFNISVKNGMEYFTRADVSAAEPLLMNVIGEINSSTVEKRIEEESAFGAPVVKVSTRTFRSWDVINCLEPMDFGDESIMTKDDVENGKKIRAEYLEGVRKDHEARQSTSSGGAFVAPAKTTATAASPTASTDFKF